MKSYFGTAGIVFTNVKIYFAAKLFVNGKSNAKQLKTFTFAAVEKMMQPVMQYK